MSQNEKRTRMLLILGIIISVGVSVVLHIRLAEKREAAEAAENDPGRRAAEALQDADRALINNNFEGAARFLEKAISATDEALTMRPGDMRLGRNRLLLTRRMAVVAQKMGRVRVACEYLEISTEQAASLFDSEPTNSRMRGDYLGTVREWASDETCPRDEIAKALEKAAKAVDASAVLVPRTGLTRVQSARTWVDLAQLEAARDGKEAALEAAKRALILSAERAEDEHDPVSTASTAYAITADLIEVAEKVAERPTQIEFERAAIEVLEMRAKLSPDDTSVLVTLGARRGRLGEFLEETGALEEAETLHTASIDVIRQAFEHAPQNSKTRQFLVRSLSRKAAHYSAQKKNKKAEALYGEAAKMAAELGKEACRTRLIALGNHAQLLGRLDRTRKARKTAATAYTLALELVQDSGDDPRARGDAVSAGLRYARLLRAPPGANRSRARKVARTERARLRALPGERSKRQKTLGIGLDALLAELR